MVFGGWARRLTYFCRHSAQAFSTVKGSMLSMHALVVGPDCCTCSYLLHDTVYTVGNSTGRSRRGVGASGRRGQGGASGGRKRLANDRGSRGTYEAALHVAGSGGPTELGGGRSAELSRQVVSVVVHNRRLRFRGTDPQAGLSARAQAQGSNVEQAPTRPSAVRRRRAESGVRTVRP